jgi:hypothetical protein
MSVTALFIASPLAGAEVGFLLEAHPAAIAIPNAPDATIAHFIASTPLLAVWDVQLRLDRFLSSFIGRAGAGASMNRKFSRLKVRGKGALHRSAASQAVEECSHVNRVDHLNLDRLCP